MDLGHMNPVPTLGVHRSVGFIRFSVAGDPGIPFGECYMEPRILRACYCGSFLLAASEGGNPRQVNVSKLKATLSPRGQPPVPYEKFTLARYLILGFVSKNSEKKQTAKPQHEPANPET